jgi:hypothetical protein
MKLPAMEMETEYLCCNNVGEHLKDMLTLCEEFAMVLDLTAPDTLQHNGVVEHHIIILKQRALAMMITVDFVKQIRELLWWETVNCANDLENISASTLCRIFPIEMMTGNLSKLFPMLQPFGRIGCVTIHFKAIWKEKSVKNIMVGCMQNNTLPIRT